MVRQVGHGTFHSTRPTAMRISPRTTTRQVRASQQHAEQGNLTRFDDHVKSNQDKTMWARASHHPYRMLSHTNTCDSLMRFSLHSCHTTHGMAR
jgi:hypothetical protein